MCVVNTAECLSQAENGQKRLHVAYSICGSEYSPFSLSLWSRLTPYCLWVSLTLVHPLVTLCTLVCVWSYCDAIGHCGCESVLLLFVVIVFNVKHVTLESINDSIFCLFYIFDVAPVAFQAVY